MNFFPWLELTAAQADIVKVASTLASMRQQYFEQQEELHDDKIALGVLLDEERSAAYDLRRNLKKAEISIAYLNTKVSALESGARDKVAVHNGLQMKLTAAAAAEATTMTKWDTERQQLRDEIARAQREERRAKQERDETLETIRRAKTEEDEYQSWRSKRARDSRDRDTSRPSENTSRPSNCLFTRSALEDTTPVQGQPKRGPLCRKPSELTPQCHRELEQAPTEGPEKNNRSQRLHIACSLGTSRPSSGFQHQRTQLEARTIDARTLTTTISEMSWAMIGFKIASSRTSARTLPATGERSGTWTRSSKL